MAAGVIEPSLIASTVQLIPLGLEPHSANVKARLEGFVWSCQRVFVLRQESTRYEAVNRGPGAYICNQCVALCADPCVEANRQAGPDPQEPLLADGPSAPWDIPKHPAGPSTTHRKYNEDAILEILSEYLADANGFDTFSSRSILFGAPGKDLRLISVIGELGDNELLHLDFQELDRQMDFNGTHD